MHIATVHEGHKPFNCGICRNAQRVEDYDPMTEHRKKQRPFECSKCSKTFNTRKDMKSHMLNVHQIYLFVACLDAIDPGDSSFESIK